MGFLYSNLIAGTRTQKMTGIVPEDLGDGRVGYVLRNDGTAEKSMYVLNVTLHTGTDYVLSFWSENTTNMSGTKWCVINQASGALAAYRIFDSQGPGGGLSHRAFPTLGQCRGWRTVHRALRQRGDHGRKNVCRIIRRHHADRGHDAPRMGSGSRGGVA